MIRTFQRMTMSAVVAAAALGIPVAAGAQSPPQPDVNAPRVDLADLYRSTGRERAGRRVLVAEALDDDDMLLVLANAWLGSADRTLWPTTPGSPRCGCTPWLPFPRNRSAALARHRPAPKSDGTFSQES